MVGKRVAMIVRGAVGTRSYPGVASCMFRLVAVNPVSLRDGEYVSVRAPVSMIVAPCVVVDTLNLRVCV